MSKVILFGGGDGGGLIIGPNGVKPIPPWDPSLRLQLRALNQLVRADTLAPKKEVVKALRGTISKLTGAVLTQIETLAGELDADVGLVYQDGEGGFSCGSTGRPPIPFPWPVDPLKTIGELFSRGLLNAQSLSFLEQAAQAKMDVFTVARDPEAAAKKLGVQLTDEVSESLAALNLGEAEIADEVDNQVLQFYRKVVADGRYITDWSSNPSIVAERLKLKISPEVHERITEIRDRGAFGRLGPGAVMSPAVVAIAIAVVIVVSRRELDLPVLDMSGIKKL